MFQLFEKSIRDDKDLLLIYQLPDAQVNYRVNANQSSLLVYSAKSARSGLTGSSSGDVSPNAQRSEKAQARVKTIAEQLILDDGKYPSRNQLSKLANCGKDLASKVLKDLIAKDDNGEIRASS